MKTRELTLPASFTDATELTDRFDGLSVIRSASASVTFSPLDKLSLRVGRGEIVGLLAGTAPARQCASKRSWASPELIRAHDLVGRDITRTDSEQTCAARAYLSPAGDVIFGGMTTAQNISCVLEHTQMDRGERDRRLQELLDTFDIDYVRDVPSPRLSGGERRRCEVAGRWPPLPRSCRWTNPSPVSIRCRSRASRTRSSSSGPWEYPHVGPDAPRDDRHRRSRQTSSITAA